MFTLEPCRRIELAGGEILVHADAADSDQQLELFEFRVPPTYPGPPRHVHRQADELFVILEGAAYFELGGESLVAHAGERVLVNRGVPHLFRNASDTELRMLVAFTPAIGMSDYFVRLKSLLERSGGDPASDDLAALWKRYDTMPA